MPLLEILCCLRVLLHLFYHSHFICLLPFSASSSTAHWSCSISTTNHELMCFFTDSKIWDIDLKKWWNTRLLLERHYLHLFLFRLSYQSLLPLLAGRNCVPKYVKVHVYVPKGKAPKVGPMTSDLPPPRLLLTAERMEKSRHKKKGQSEEREQGRRARPAVGSTMRTRAWQRLKAALSECL